MYKVTILGCGSSGGVPRSDGSWGDCDPTNPKNRRMRCSIKVEKLGPDANTIVIIDTSPDLRNQLLLSKTTRIDGVIFSHDHADQTHGIDDLRAIVYSNRRKIESFLENSTSAALLKRFDYVFEGYEKPHYPSLLIPNLINWNDKFTINGDGGAIEFTPLKLIHGAIENMGVRFGNIAYCNDVNIIPDETLDKMQSLDLLIIDALRYTKHPSHAHLDQSLEWIDQLKPKQAILTNLHIDMDYETLLAKLPENVLPAYDLMEVII